MYRQEYEGNLNFATDTWMSPNHKVYVAVMVHFEKDSKPVCMILDIVEVTMAHSGINLAQKEFSNPTEKLWPRQDNNLSRENKTKIDSGYLAYLPKTSTRTRRIILMQTNKYTPRITGFASQNKNWFS
jgi:hypothetical protein